MKNLNHWVCLFAFLLAAGCVSVDTQEKKDKLIQTEEVFVPAPADPDSIMGEPQGSMARYILQQMEEEDLDQLMAFLEKGDFRNGLEWENEETGNGFRVTLLMPKKSEDPVIRKAVVVTTKNSLVAKIGFRKGSDGEWIAVEI